MRSSSRRSGRSSTDLRFRPRGSTRGEGPVFRRPIQNSLTPSAPMADECLAMRVPALGDWFLMRVAAALAAATLLAGCGEPDRPKGRFVGKAPPALDATEATWVNADPMTWADLRGRVVLLEFGFLGCPACRLMSPNLAAWYRAYSEEGLTVVYVEEGRATPLPDLRERVATDGMPYPVLHDGAGATAQAFGVKAYPLAYVVNRAGTVVWEGVPIRNPAAVEVAIRNALAN